MILLWRIHVGNKGYTILKNLYRRSRTRNKITSNSSPFLPKSPIKPPSLPIYRESIKYYVPRFLGFLYGLPKGQRLEW